MLTLITPTADRHDFLLRTYSMLCKQTIQDWQWWICDTSYRPWPFREKLKDKRIHYHFESLHLSIGYKRNNLIRASTGEIIVHIDDDDYYAPDYLEHILKLLEDVDFVYAASWYAYDIKNAQGYYWQASALSSNYYLVDALSAGKVQQLTLGDKAPERIKNSLETVGKYGYGFSYAYRKKIWLSHGFEDIDLQEDSRFLRHALDRAFIGKDYCDERGVVVKIIHDCNISCIYPQYRIPHFLMKQYLPHFMETMHALDNTTSG